MATIIKFKKPEKKDPMTLFIESLDDRQQYLFEEIMTELEKEFYDMQETIALLRIENTQLKRKLNKDGNKQH